MTKWALIASVLIVATTVVFALGPVLTTERGVSTELPPSLSQLPLRRESAVAKQDAERLAEPSEVAAPYTIRAPFEIEDAVTFGPTDAVKTRLANVTAPPRAAVCFDRDRSLWACGLQARAALNNLVRGKELTCAPSAPGATPAAYVEAQCTAGRTDIGLELVRLGFARPSSDDPALLEAEAAARSEQVGLWAGGWSIR